MTDWSEVVRQHGPIVWKTAWRLLGNQADAADCFQDAFLAALEVSAREPVLHWAALLRRLATRKALQRLRQRYRGADRLVALDDSPPLAAPGPGPDRAAEAAELSERLRDALADLDDRQATVFCLARLDGLSYEEIAAQLGLTVNHVGVLLNRARSQLQRRLRAHGTRRSDRQDDKESRT